MKKLFFLFIMFQNTIVAQSNEPSSSHSMAKDFICNDSLKIESTYDRFTKTTFYKYVGKNITIGKMIDSALESTYFINLNLESQISTSSNGIKILLSNGELITRSKEYPKIVYLNSKYCYMGSILLENLDIKSMLEYNITDFRMGGLDATVLDGYELKEALKCLMKK